MTKLSEGVTPLTLGSLLLVPVQVLNILFGIKVTSGFMAVYILLCIFRDVRQRVKYCLIPGSITDYCYYIYYKSGYGVGGRVGKLANGAEKV